MQTCELFSSRGTLEEAAAYSNRLIESMPPEHRLDAFTALHVTLNTAIKLLEENDLTKYQLTALKPYKMKVADMPRALAIQELRNSAPLLLLAGFDLERHGAPELGSRLGQIAALLAKAFGITVEDLAEEAGNMLGARP
jgi:hypothetical protein